VKDGGDYAPPDGVERVVRCQESSTKQATGAFERRWLGKLDLVGDEHPLDMLRMIQEERAPGTERELDDIPLAGHLLEEVDRVPPLMAKPQQR